MALHHTTSAERGLQDQTNLLPRAKLLAVFITLAVTLLITFLDQNGISVAIPTIATDIHAQATISWAGTSSLVANTMFQMLYGRLSDIFGRKAVYLAAIALLAVADMCCGLSQNAAMFYVFRGLAGVGGGGVTNLAMIIVSDIVTLEQRGKYQGILGAAVGMGNILGPFLAAAFVERAHYWRGYFYLLAPLSGVSGLVSYFLLPSKPGTTSFRDGVRKIDYLGWFTSSVAVVFLLIPISGGGAYFSWNSPMVISMLVIGGLFFVAFLVAEWKFAKLPMMPSPVSTFTSPALTAMLVQNFLFGAAYQSYLYYLPMYIQNAHQLSSLMSATICIALVGMQSVTSVSAGQYISRTKRYGEVLWFGFGIWTLGCGLALTYTRHTPPKRIIPPLMLMGMGVGCIFQPIIVALQAHSIKSRRAVIISNRNFFRSAGGACGLAVSAALLQAQLRSHLPPQYAYLAHSTYALPDLTNNPDAPAILDAYMAGSRAVFILQIPLIGLCFLGCIFVKDRGLSPPEDKIPETTETSDENIPDIPLAVPQKDTTGQPTSSAGKLGSTEKTLPV